MNYSISEKGQIYSDQDHYTTNSGGGPTFSITVYAVFFSIMGFIVIIVIVCRACGSNSRLASVRPSAAVQATEMDLAAGTPDNNPTEDYNEEEYQNQNVIVSMETP